MITNFKILKIMKVKHLLLGIALVALVAACGKKEAPVETPTETAIETPAVEVETPVEEPVAAPAPAKTTQTAKPAAKPAAKPEQPKVDPCEKLVAEYEAYATRLQGAKKVKANGPKQLEEWLTLRKEVASRDAKIKECVSNPTYKSRVQQAAIIIVSSSK
jgi:type IV secretory pathway VirB10-like protein